MTASSPVFVHDIGVELRPVNALGHLHGVNTVPETSHCDANSPSS
jgi:hypothetical protein